MKDIVLLYDGCCIYEIVILNYFLQYTNSQVLFCFTEKPDIKSMEGYSIHADMHLSEAGCGDVRSFIVPGGMVRQIETDLVLKTVKKLHQQGTLVAGICAGVDILEQAGILEGIPSTHSTDADCIRAGNVVTARANAYVDFAIEVGKALDLFEDEEDLRGTVDFWKYFKRAQ